VAEADLPRPAIRPYPSRYVGAWTLKDGTPVTIRPIRPEDEPLMVKFHQTLSERSVQLRYFHALQLSQRVAHERLTRICFNDYDREMALVAEHRDAASGEREIAAVSRLIKLHDAPEAECALLVNDRFQGRGLGLELLRRLIQVGREEKLRRITADIMPDNHVMQALCKKLGFRMKYQVDEQLVAAELML
jgi:acetyltransferase